MSGDMKCGTCVLGYFPIHEESGARSWSGRCAYNTRRYQHIEQHFKCSNNKYIPRVSNEASVGSKEQDGESAGVQQTEV